MKCIALLTILFVCVGHAGAALTALNGKESEGWDDGSYSIVVAKIRKIKQSDKYGNYTAVIEPMATLAGILDPSVHPVLPVRFGVDLPTAQSSSSYIRRVPPDGATVLAVVSCFTAESVAKAKREYWIAGSICTFMPEQSGMIAIRGLDDPKVILTLQRIQLARAEAREERSTKAKTATKE